MLLVAPWAALAHAGEPEDKLLGQRIIADGWPETVTACRLGLTIQSQPESGAKFYIKLTSRAHSVWKGMRSRKSSAVQSPPARRSQIG